MQANQVLINVIKFEMINIFLKVSMYKIIIMIFYGSWNNAVAPGRTLNQIFVPIRTIRGNSSLSPATSIKGKFGNIQVAIGKPN